MKIPKTPWRKNKSISGIFRIFYIITFFNDTSYLSLYIGIFLFFQSEFLKYNKNNTSIIINKMLHLDDKKSSELV
jgi:hypothetical protein